MTTQTVQPQGRLLEYVDGDLANEPLSDEEIAFDDFRNSLGAGEDMGTVRVGRIPAGSNTAAHATNAKSVYCFSFPVDRFNFDELCEYIRTNYGGGLYRLIGVQKGKKGSAFNRLLEIAEPLKQKNPSGEQQQNLGSIMDAVSNLIASQAERTEQLLQRLGVGAIPVAAPPVDPMDMMTKMMGIITGMMTAMNGVRPQGGGDFIDQLEKHAKVADLLGNLGGGGGGRSESNFYDLAGKTLETVAPVLKAALPALMAPKAGGPSRRAPIPELAPKVNPNTTPPPAGSGPAVIPENNQGKSMDLTNQVGILVAQAKAGASPEYLAEMILSMTPAARVPELKAFIGDPKLIERMTKVNAEVANYVPFFEALKTNVLEMLAADEAGEQGGEDSGADDAGE